MIPARQTVASKRHGRARKGHHELSLASGRAIPRVAKLYDFSSSRRTDIDEEGQAPAALFFNVVVEGMVRNVAM